MATSNIYLKFISSLKDGASFATKKMLGGIVTSAKFAANRVAAVGGAFAGMGRSALSQAANVKAVFDMMMGAARSFAGAVAGLVRRAFDAEYAVTNFKTLLGTMDAAKKHVADLKKFAAETPLTFGDLSQASKTLLAFGLSVDDVLPTLKMLGDISLGNSEKMQSLSLAFGKVQSEGKLTGVTLKQMIIAGFNPLQEIAAKTGEKMDDLKKLMEQGGISTDLVRAAMQSATAEGGRFHDALKDASKTGAGLFSTMQDNWNAMLAKFGEAFMDVTKGGMTKLIETMQRLMNDGSLQVWANKTKRACDEVVKALGPVVKSLGWVLEKSADVYNWVRDKGEVAGNAIGGFVGSLSAGGSLQDARRAGAKAWVATEQDQRMRKLEAAAEDARLVAKATEEVVKTATDVKKLDIKGELDKAKASVRKEDAQAALDKAEFEELLDSEQRLIDEAAGWYDQMEYLQDKRFEIAKEVGKIDAALKRIDKRDAARKRTEDMLATGREADARHTTGSFGPYQYGGRSNGEANASDDMRAARFSDRGGRDRGKAYRRDALNQARADRIRGMSEQARSQADKDWLKKWDEINGRRTQEAQDAKARKLLQEKRDKLLEENNSILKDIKECLETANKVG